MKHDMNFGVNRVKDRGADFCTDVFAHDQYKLVVNHNLEYLGQLYDFYKRDDPDEF